MNDKPQEQVATDPYIAKVAANLKSPVGAVEALERLVKAAEGLSHGTDWNNGTHVKLHGYRRKLVDAIPEAAEALAALRSTFAPGHTDLMVTPESIDAFMEANPLDEAHSTPSPKREEVARVISENVEIEFRPGVGGIPRSVVNTSKAADAILSLFGRAG